MIFVLCFQLLFNPADYFYCVISVGSGCCNKQSPRDHWIHKGTQSRQGSDIINCCVFKINHKSISSFIMIDVVLFLCPFYFFMFIDCDVLSTSWIQVESPACLNSEVEQSRCNKMDLHQLPGSLYSSPQPYSVTAIGLDQNPSSFSADDKIIEKLSVPNQIGQKIHPFISILNIALTSNVCLTDASTCLCYQFFI